jgi:hypothetical protein
MFSLQKKYFVSMHADIFCILLLHFPVLESFISKKLEKNGWMEEGMDLSESCFKIDPNAKRLPASWINIS